MMYQQDDVLLFGRLTYLLQPIGVAKIMSGVHFSSQKNLTTFFALTDFPRKLRVKFFHRPGGRQVHPLHPLATPMLQPRPAATMQLPRSIATSKLPESGKET